MSGPGPGTPVWSLRVDSGTAQTAVTPRTRFFGRFVPFCNFCKMQVVFGAGLLKSGPKVKNEIVIFESAVKN